MSPWALARARVCVVALALALTAVCVPDLAAAQPREVRDDLGTVIRLAEPTRRIVSLSPHATELLFEVGAGTQLVGVSGHSDYPPAARALRRVGDSNRIDLEAIAALHPDLVVAWASALPPHSLAALQGLGIPVFRSEPRHLDEIPSTLERLGRLTGTEASAGDAASRFRANLAALHARYGGRPVVSVFFQVWHAPLMTINGVQIMSDVIRLCGGRNVFAADQLMVPTIDPEAVVAVDPEVIVAALDGGTAAAGEAFARWRALPRMRAVARAHLFALDANLITRQTSRILLGAATLCTALEQVRTGR